jgi:hypothetical protein
MYAPEFVEFVDELRGATSSEELKVFKRAVRLDEAGGEER